MSDPTTRIQVPRNPFVGPDPCPEREGDPVPVLPGRKRETSALIDLLIGKRIVLFIAPPGAGKTSLIEAALRPRIRTHLNPLPTVRLDRVPRDSDPKANRYVVSSLCSLQSCPCEGGAPQVKQPPADELMHLSLAAYFRGLASPRDAGDATEAARFNLLILDQFEELFTLDRSDWEAKEVFLKQLGEALGGGPADANQNEDEPAQPLWALLSMREDYVAELEPFLHLIPTGLAFRYHMMPLSRDQAIEAVTGMAGTWFQPAAAVRLVDDLLRTPSGSSAGRLTRRKFVEPVQLQVACLLLWDEVVALHKRPIQPEDIGAAGHDSVDAALAAYYDTMVAKVAASAGLRERELRDWVEDSLISGPSKVRTRAVLEQEKAPLDQPLRTLCDKHILRSDPAGEWFEISHDRFIDPILESNGRWRARNLALFQRQAKLWAAEKGPDDMLFAGDELERAEEFAGKHPELLNDNDQHFLSKSRRERERVETEQRLSRKIKAANRALALLAVGLFCLTLYAGIGWRMAYLSNDDLKRSEIDEVVGMARGGVPADTLMVLRRASDRINEKSMTMAALRRATYGINETSMVDLQVKLDQSLIEVLGSRPPIDQRIGDHYDIVHTLRFSNDGHRLFSGGWSGQLKQWTLSGNRIESTTGQDRGPDIYALAYDDVAQLLVSTDFNGLIKLWKVKGEQTEAALHELSTLNRKGDAHRGRVAAASMSPDGKQLATAGNDKRDSKPGQPRDDQPIVLWDIDAQGNASKWATFGEQFHETEIWGLAFIEKGPYSRSLVSADWNGWVGIWLLGDHPREKHSLPELCFWAGSNRDHNVGIYSLVVSPSGRWIAVGDHEGEVVLWDLLSPAVAASRGGFQCDHVSTSKREKWQNDSKIADAQRRLKSKGQHRDKVFDMAFLANDDSRLVTVGSDGALLSWEIPNDTETAGEFESKLGVRRIEGWGEKLYSVAFQPGTDGHVAVGGSKTIWLADLDRPNPIASRMPGTDAFSQRWLALTATTDLSVVAALSTNDPFVHVWRADGQHYQPVSVGDEGKWRLHRIALAPDGKTLAGLACDGKVVVWSIENGQAYWEDRAMREPRRGAEGESLQKERGEETKCAIAFGMEDSGLFATGMGSDVRLWKRDNAGDWKDSESTEGARCGSIEGLAFSPNGKLLAAAGQCNQIWIWEIVDRRLHSSPRPSEPTKYHQRALVFAADGHSLISGGGDATLVEWALSTRAESSQLTIRRQATPHRRQVTALAFGQNEGSPATFSGDEEGQLVLCAPRDGATPDAQYVSEDRCAPIGTPSGRRVDALVVSSDLSRLVVADDGGLWLWDLRRASLRATAKRLSAPAQ